MTDYDPSAPYPAPLGTPAAPAAHPGHPRHSGAPRPTPSAPPRDPAPPAAPTPPAPPAPPHQPPSSPSSTPLSAPPPSAPPPHPAARVPDLPAPPGSVPAEQATHGRAPRRIWSEHRNGLLALSVWTERVPDRGEDAEPFVAHHPESGHGLLAVFDGSGGAGAAPVWQTADGIQRTSAWAGARVARLATDCWFREVATGGEPAEPASLHEYLQYFLAAAPQRRSKIGGTMRRQLPTTLAGVHYRVRPTDGDRRVELRPLWAGDSRAYVLGPENGLQVLTRDHTRESDALELLRSDPPMTNLVCADRNFTIDSQRLTFPLPCVLVAATDGFFGYVHTPADFESLLLRTLHRAGDGDEWADLIRGEVERCTADDASLALVALGHRDFDELKAGFAARLAEMTDRYVRSRPRGLDRLSAEAGGGPSAPAEDPATLPARVRAWQDATWHAYRAGYETHLPLAPEERA